MPTVLILIFTLLIMVTVIPYAFSNVIKQLQAVKLLEQQQGTVLGLWVLSPSVKFSNDESLIILTYFVAEAAAAAANEVVTETAKEGIVLVVSDDK